MVVVVVVGGGGGGRHAGKFLINYAMICQELLQYSDRASCGTMSCILEFLPLVNGCNALRVQYNSLNGSSHYMPENIASSQKALRWVLYYVIILITIMVRYQ